MTEWYYSNGNQDRNGPIDDVALVDLHRSGGVRPDTLVWREGMPGWRPWQELLPEIAMTLPGLGDTQAGAGFGFGVDPLSASFATAGSDAPPEADGNPYSMGAPASPYAPPKARLEQQDSPGYVAGGPVVHAGFLKRYAAMAVDGVITAALSWAIQLPLMLVAAGVSAGAEASGDMLATGAGLGIVALTWMIGLAVPLLYTAWMHSSGHQATLGKMAVGIKVTLGDGHRISFWRAFGRYVLYLLSWVLFLVPALVSAFTSGLTDRKQALHDMLCDTLVVDKWAFTENKKWQNEELGVVTIVILCLSLLFTLGFIAFFIFVLALGSGFAR